MSKKKRILFIILALLVYIVSCILYYFIGRSSVKVNSVDSSGSFSYSNVVSSSPILATALDLPTPPAGLQRPADAPQYYSDSSPTEYYPSLIESDCRVQKSFEDANNHYIRYISLEWNGNQITANVYIAPYLEANAYVIVQARSYSNNPPSFTQHFGLPNDFPYRVYYCDYTVESTSGTTWTGETLSNMTLVPLDKLPIGWIGSKLPTVEGSTPFTFLYNFGQRLVESSGLWVDLANFSIGPYSLIQILLTTGLFVVFGWIIVKWAIPV